MSAPLPIVVRMPQDTSFHLAHLHQHEEGWTTVTLCGHTMHGARRITEDVTPFPFYRGRNEFTRCERCDAEYRKVRGS